MATIHKIAEQADVSIASVSRYFNNPELLRADTYAKIDAVVKNCNYVPNSIGRSLRMSRSGKILVMLPSVSNPIYQKMLSAMCEESQKRGYMILICTTNSNPYTERSMLSMLETHYVDGIIFCSTTQTKEELEHLSKKFPIVQCCEHVEANISGVAIDNEKAAYEATEYLIKAGHRRIAMASGMETYGTTKLREKGYLDALKHYGIPLQSAYLIRGEYGFSSGERAAKRWLSGKEIPDAVVTVSDAVAIGVIKEFAKNGIHAGKDISVIGFDNTTMAAKYTPSLSSVAQPRKEMGKVAVELLFERMEALKNNHRHVVLPHELIIRESIRK